MEKRAAIIQRPVLHQDYPKRGFTLIEALVTIFIIGLLTSVSLVSYRQGQKQYALEQAVQQIVADLRRAQNMALAPGKIQGAPVNGYGINFDLSRSRTNYILFTEAQSGRNQAYNLSSEKIEQINLPAKISLRGLTVSPLNIFYQPPDPITYLNNNSSAGVSAVITLEIQGTNSTKTISVNTSGLIE